MSVPRIRLQFAKRLREERLRSKLTQEKVAELIEVSARYYQMLESKNPTAIKIDTIEKLAKAFKISPAKLLDFNC
jgi:transcriptional regulator with XRE-family HTH domain